MRAITHDIKANLLKEQFIPDHVVIYVVKGGVRVFDGDKSSVIQPGEAFLARKNRLVKYELLESENGFEPVLFCFDEPFLKDFQKKHARAQPEARYHDSFFEIKQNSLLTSFMESVKPYYKGVMLLDEDFEDIKYEELLIILLKLHPEYASFLFDFAPPEKIDLEAFINKNYAFNVSVERFATLTGRSLSAFKRDFKEIFKDPPGKWLVRKRLLEAHVLLSRKNQKPADIYLDLGFKSLSHFSVAFKKQFHYTPTEATIAG